VSTAPHPAQPLPAAAPDARPLDSAAVPAPMQPHSAWTLARQAWRLYMTHRAPFLLPVLLFEIPLLLCTVAVLALLDPGPPALTVDYVTRFTIFTTVDSTLTLIESVLAFLLLALIAVQIAAGLRGGRLRLGDAFRAVLPRLGALLGGSFLLVMSVGLLTVFGVFLAVVFSLVLTVINADPNSGGLAGAIQRGLADPTQDLWLRLVLLAAVTAAVIFLVVRWSLMVQIVVLEDAPPLHSLRRSWFLVGRAFWRTLGLLLLGMLPLTLLSNGTLLAEFFNLVPAGADRVTALALARGLGLAVRLLLLPWALALLTLYYYDLRLRRDGAARRAAD
jgi:hypothetical protein